MAVIYATLIVKGAKTIDDVPAKIKEQVKQVLKDLEVEIQESEEMKKNMEKLFNNLSMVIGAVGGVIVYWL